MSKNKLARAAGMLMFVTIISKLIGFVRDALVAGTFGTTYQSDAYLLSLTIPNILFNIFGMAITTTFIPILSESFSKKSKEDMFEFANTIMNILLILSVLLCIIGWINASFLVKIIAPNYSGTAYELTVFLTRLSIINIMFLSMTSGYAAVLQTLDEFTAPALVGVVMNIPIIIYLLSNSRYGIKGLTVATIIGNGIQILIQLPWLIKHGYKYKFRINFKDNRIKKMFILIAPILIGTGVNQINTFVDRMMASGLAEGSIAALDFSNKLTTMLYFTFASAVATVVFPSLSRFGGSKEYGKLRDYASRSINCVNLLMVPSVMAMTVLRVPIINVIFKHGVFDNRGVEMTATAMLYSSVGMIFFGVRDILNKAFYAVQDTRTPMINGVAGVILNIISNLLIVRHMGIGGLTLSTSLSAMITSVLLIKDLRKKIGGINGRELLISSVKIIIASTIMGIVIFIFNSRFNLMQGLKRDILSLLICTIVGTLVYVILLIILEEKEFKYIIKIINEKLKNRKKLSN